MSNPDSDIAEDVMEEVQEDSEKNECEEYIEEEGDQIVEDYEEELEYEDQEEEHVDIHDDEEFLNFSNEQDDDPEEPEQVEEKSDVSSEKEDNADPPETISPEEKLEMLQQIDGYQRQIEEEKYTLRKLRSIIGHQADSIDSLRNRIARYTRDAQDSKAAEAMEKLKHMKQERETAVEQRKTSTELLGDLRSKREDKIKELRDRGVKIDTDKTYLIEDVELKNLFLEIKRTLLKYNSFAVLKYTVEELDPILDHVAGVSDRIDDYLTCKDVRPRDMNKLNTKERRVLVLYDKLLKWREYKAKDPDIRSTDYESFLYDPDDMFSESDEEPDQREKTRVRKRSRERRAVRGGSPTEERDRKSRISDRSPVRPPSPAPAHSMSQKIHAPLERRAVCGGDEEEEEEETEERGVEEEEDEEEQVEEPRHKKTLLREPIIRADGSRVRNQDKDRIRRSDARRRRPEPLLDAAVKRRSVVDSSNSPDRSRFSPVRHRHTSHDKPRYFNNNNNNRRSPMFQRKDRGERSRDRMPGLHGQRSDGFSRREKYGGGSRMSRKDRSPSPQLASSYVPRHRSHRVENFQISIKNEGGFNPRNRAQSPRRDKFGAKPMRRNDHPFPKRTTYRR